MQNKTCNSNMKKRYLAYIIPALFISACGNGSTAPSTSIHPNPPLIPCATCTIFFAGNNSKGYNGDLESQAIALGAPNSINGIQGDDYICQMEAESREWHPSIPSGNSHIYKALIVDGQNRISCTTPNCGVGGVSENLNWVLYPNTNYVNESNQLIGITNESAILNFPTTNSFTFGSTSYKIYESSNGSKVKRSPPIYRYFVWTGESKDFTSFPNSNCKNWSTPVVDSTGSLGEGVEAYITRDSFRESVFVTSLQIGAYNHASPGHTIIPEFNCQVHSGGAVTFLSNTTGMPTIKNANHTTVGLLCVEQN